MKEKVSSKIYKPIICLIAVVIMFKFPITNISYAADVDGSSAYDPFMKFITYLCDNLMQFMQNTFTTTQSIENINGTYKFQYSPAIIFSGTVPSFDINFIAPNADVRNVNNFDAYIRAKKNDLIEEVDQVTMMTTTFNQSGVKINEVYTNKREEYENKDGVSLIEWKEDLYAPKYSVYYYEEDNNLKICIFKYIIRSTENGQSTSQQHSYCFKEYSEEITDEFLNNVNNITTYSSIANELQPTIAKYYNALRKIALVGLLSVLIYLGIRIVLSSSSSEGKSKYKKLLMNWLVALCLLFTLHYLMNLIFVVSQKLTEIFTLGETDELLNNIRQNINEAEDWGVAFTEVLMYVVIVIYTCIFTFQYLRRVLYMAFFTMIAPLITLTYPLDKIKDGKAQAFTMWIREYIFNALIPVVHLIVYYTLVGSVMALVEEYPLFALVAIGFMTQGEKIIRKMFGFNNSETIGTMGAMAMGGLINNGLNKLKSLPKGGSAGGKEGSEESRRNVRTATSNSLASLQGNAGGTTSGAKQNRDIKFGSGAGAVIKKYYGKTLTGAAGVLTGGAGAMLGLAAGISQGDIAGALGGAIAGGKVGMNLPQNAVNKVKGMGTNVKNTLNDVRDTFNEGAYGEEAANNIRFDREFKKGSTYKALKGNANFSEDSVDAMLDAGITDKGAMEKILNSGQNVDDAIGYYTLAQKCPDSIYYDDAKLEMYLEDLGLSTTDAKTMRDNMRKFK